MTVIRFDARVYQIEITFVVRALHNLTAAANDWRMRLQLSDEICTKHTGELPRSHYSLCFQIG